MRQLSFIELQSGSVAKADPEETVASVAAQLRQYFVAPCHSDRAELHSMVPSTHRPDEGGNDTVPR